MKGAYFQKPMEFRLSVDGESWRQGDSIAGSLTVKNHSAGALPVAGVSVKLARGTLRKVHQKAEDAFQIIGSVPVPESAGASLAPQQELAFPWKFETDRGCPISDTVSSVFLLYGQAPLLGHLQVPVQPDEVITHFLDVMKTSFRFVPKSVKWSKGGVDVKLAPPDSRGFASLEQLELLFGFEGETLQVEYHFKLKKVEASAAAVELKKQESVLKQSYEPALYRTASGRFDHERVEKELRDVLGTIESKTLL